MSNIRELVLTNKLVTIVQELRDHKFLGDVSKFCGQYKILTDLESWATKNQDVKLLAPIAECFKRGLVGEVAIIYALYQCHVEAKEAFWKLPSVYEKHGLFSVEFSKEVCEVLEIAHFLNYVAKNMPIFTKYVPVIGIVGEGGELVGSTIKLCESLSRTYQYFKYESTHGSGSVTLQEKNIAVSRCKACALKVMVYSLKLLSMCLGFYGYSLLIETACSAASLSISLLTSMYEARNAEGKYHDAQCDKLNKDNKKLKDDNSRLKDLDLEKIGDAPKDLRNEFHREPVSKGESVSKGK